MFDLCQPMRGIDHGRKVFVEGDLKYKDGTGKVRALCQNFTDKNSRRETNLMLASSKMSIEKVRIYFGVYFTSLFIHVLSVGAK